MSVECWEFRLPQHLTLNTRHYENRKVPVDAGDEMVVWMRGPTMGAGRRGQGTVPGNRPRLPADSPRAPVFSRMSTGLGCQLRRRAGASTSGEPPPWR